MPARWARTCSRDQAVQWLGLATENALTEGGTAAVRLAEAVEHFVAVARRAL